MLPKKMLLNIFPIYLVIFQLPIQFKIGKCQREFLNRSDFGEYFIDWKYVGPCQSSKSTNEIQFNIKLTKKNKRSQITGNHTLLIPWDEIVFVELRYAKLGLTSDWTKTAHVWTLAGCTQYISLIGSEFLGHMNLPNKCPIPKGVYVMKEYDLEKLLEDVSPMVPKAFFYGSFIIIWNLKKNGRMVGCARMALDFIPKWQRRNKTRYRN